MRLYKLTGTFFRLRLTPHELTLLEEALIAASRTNELSSESAEFITELLNRITEVAG